MFANSYLFKVCLQPTRPPKWVVPGTTFHVGGPVAALGDLVAESIAVAFPWVGTVYGACSTVAPRPIHLGCRGHSSEEVGGASAEPESLRGRRADLADSPDCGHEAPEGRQSRLCLRAASAPMLRRSV